jgi:hypothetical protein
MSTGSQMSRLLAGALLEGQSHASAIAVHEEEAVRCGFLFLLL